MVHDTVQGQHGSATEMRTVRLIVGTRGQRDAMCRVGIRQEHDGIVRRKLGVRRLRKHHRHGSTCIYDNIVF